MTLTIGFIVGLIVVSLAYIICRNSLNSTSEPSLAMEYIRHDGYGSIGFHEPTITNICYAHSIILECYKKNNLGYNTVINLIVSKAQSKKSLVIKNSKHPNDKIDNAVNFLAHACMHPDCPENVKLYFFGGGYAGLTLKEFISKVEQ
jgi:hypothetical protein